VKTVGNDKTAIHDTASWAEVVVLTVPFVAIDDIVKHVGSALGGKIVIDATNALDAQMNLAVGFNTSGVENLQRKVPKAPLVKAFNTVFAQHMGSGSLGDEALSAFVAGDDADAKTTVLELAVVAT